MKGFSCHGDTVTKGCGAGYAGPPDVLCPHWDISPKKFSRTEARICSASLGYPEDHTQRISLRDEDAKKRRVHFRFSRNAFLDLPPLWSVV